MANRRSILGPVNVFDAEIIEENQPPNFDLEKELVGMIKGSYQTLNELWDKIGIFGNDREMRARALLHYHQDLQKNMIDEENSLYIRLVNIVNELKTELVAVQRQLKMEVTEDVSLEQKSVLQQERLLKETVGKLLKIKFERLDNLVTLLEQEMALCSALDLTPINNGLKRTGDEDVDDANVPSELQLREIEHHIKELQNEKECRLSNVEVMQLGIVDVLDDLQMTPSNNFEEAIVSMDDNIHKLLSLDTMNKIKIWLEELRQLQILNKATLKRLLSCLITLWDGLGIEPPEREAFLSTFTHHGQPTITTFEQEIARYQEIKKQNIGKFIDRLREELVQYWEKCYVAKEERDNFVAYKDATFTEDLLDLHELELNKWKQMYEDNERIYSKIIRRNEVWEQKRIYDKKSNDPTRFHNRGGNLLQEEKARKRVEHELPKLDFEIENMIVEWEKQQQNAEVFIINGVTYRDFVEGQREALKVELENEKKLRALQKANEGGKCMITPTKRKAQSAKNTPASTAKHPRLNLATKTTPLTMGMTARSPATIRNAPRSSPKKTISNLQRQVSGKIATVSPMVNLELAVPQRPALNEIQSSFFQIPQDIPRASITYSEFSEQLKKKDDGVFNSTSADKEVEDM